MKSKVMKRTLLLTCIVYLLLIGTLYAEQQIAVAVFPFSIQASQNNNLPNQLTYEKLSESLAAMLKEDLEKNGAKVVLVKDVTDKEGWDYSQFRQEGIKLGVDRIVTGNIFIAGNRVSIDAQMHNIYEKHPPTTFFSQAPTIESLNSATTELGKEIIGELFQKKVIASI